MFPRPLELIILEHLTTEDLLAIVQDSNVEVKAESKSEAVPSEAKVEVVEVPVATQPPFGADPVTLKQAATNRFIKVARIRLAVFAKFSELKISDTWQVVDEDAISSYSLIHDEVLAQLKKMLITRSINFNLGLLSVLTDEQLALVVEAIKDHYPDDKNFIYNAILRAYLNFHRDKEYAKLLSYHARLMTHLLKSIDDTAIVTIEQHLSDLIYFILENHKKYPDLFAAFIQSNLAKKVLNGDYLNWERIADLLAKEADVDLLKRVLDCADKLRLRDQETILYVFVKNKSYKFIMICLQRRFFVDGIVEVWTVKLYEYILRGYFDRAPGSKELLAMLVEQLQTKSIRFSARHYDLEVESLLRSIIKLSSDDKFLSAVSEYPELLTIDSVPPQGSARFYQDKVHTLLSVTALDPTYHHLAVALMKAGAPLDQINLIEFIDRFARLYCQWRDISIRDSNPEFMEDYKKILTELLKVLSKLDDRHPALQIVFKTMRENNIQSFMAACIDGLPRLLMITDHESKDHESKDYRDQLPWQKALLIGNLHNAQFFLDKMLEHKISLDPQHGARAISKLLRRDMTREHLGVIRRLLELKSELPPHRECVLPIGRGFNNTLFAAEDPLFAELISVLRVHPRGNEWIVAKISDSASVITGKGILDRDVEEVLSLITSGALISPPLPKTPSFKCKILLEAAFEVCRSRNQFKAVLKEVQQVSDDKMSLLLAQIQQLLNTDNRQLWGDESKIIHQVQSKLIGLNSTEEIRGVIQSAILDLLTALEHSSTDSDRRAYQFFKGQPQFVGLQKLLFLQQYLYLGLPELTAVPVRSAAAAARA